MNKRLIITALLITITFLGFSQEYPIIKNFGGIYEIEEAVEYPDSNITYKIIVDVKFKPKPDQLNYGLENIARMMNLHGLGGVKKENLDVIAIIHGGSAFSIMDNETYKEKFGVDNPNIPLMDELSKQGVRLFVCGQSLKSRKIETDNVYNKVKISLSALTMLTTYQQKGYALLIFN